MNMEDIKKETIVTQKGTASPVFDVRDGEKATNSQTIEYLAYFLFGVLEVLLAFRLILKLTGANIGSAFVGFIYGVTGIFTLPFEGIFSKGFARGVEVTAVFEPATLVAILVYAVLAWGVIKLIRIFSGDKQPV